MNEEWVPKSRACKELKITWYKLSQFIYEGQIATKKSIRNHNTVFVDLNQLRAYLAQDEQVKVK